MLSLTRAFIDDLTAAEQPPCLSLYQPTHRHHPDNQQDPIRFRNLLKELESSLRQRYRASDTASLLAPFESLAVEAKGGAVYVIRSAQIPASSGVAATFRF